MKKYKFLLFSTCLVLLFSCTENKEKYYGKWNLMPEYFSDDELYQIEISKDSISFISGLSYNNKLSYPLKIERGKLYFKDTLFNVSIENDTLLKFNKTIYINHKVCKDIYSYNEDYNQFVKINYSQLKNQRKLTFHNSYISFMYYGKNPTTNEYVLQLNDKFIKDDFRYLKEFLYGHHHNINLNQVIFITDKNSPMKELSKIFFEIRTLGDIKIYFITNHNLKINDSLKLSYQFEGIIKRLAIRFPEEKTIHSNPPPIPNGKEYLLKNIITRNNYVVSLIDNKFYFGINEVSKIKLIEILTKKIKTEQPTFLTFFDDISVYSNYLGLLHSFDVAYHSLRNKKSKEIFKKEFDNLNQKERRKIFEFIPRKTYDGISYSQFKKLNIKIPELKLIE